MERERLTRLLEEPGRMVREDLSDLKAMAQQYPWFSGARLLHAAGEQLSGQVLADETLRTAAAHLPSREALFDLANRVAAPAPLRVVRTLPEAPEAPFVLVAAPIAEPEATHEEAAEHRVETTPAIAIAETAAMAPEQAFPEVDAAGFDPSGDADTSIDFRASTTRPAEPAAPPSAEEQPTKNDLEEEYVKAALARAYELTWKEPVIEPSPALPPALPEAETASESLAPSARLRFSAWLDAADQRAVQVNRGKPSGKGVPSPTAEGSPRQIENSATPITATGTQILGASMPAETSPQTLDSKALIDRFIRQQPPEIPAKPAFFTPQQAGKKSLEDSAGLVTETLARIYEQQGNYAKAMEAYNRLALKYPEKSAYFAALSKAAEAQQTP
jgi:tetratricopeptide (TPR) repeat protein